MVCMKGVIWQIHACMIIKVVQSFFFFQHEEASSKMFDHMMKENPHLQDEFEQYNLGEQDIIFIKELICGKKQDKENWTSKSRPKNKAFLYEVRILYNTIGECVHVLYCVLQASAKCRSATLTYSTFLITGGSKQKDRS